MTHAGPWRRAFDGAPAALLVAAALLAAVYLALELCGWRDAVGVLSGTMPEPGGAHAGGVARGIAFALAWFGAVLAAPAMALGGLALALIRRAIEAAGAARAD